MEVIVFMEKFKKYMGILDKGLNAIGIAFLVVSIVLAVFAVIGFIGIDGVEIGEIDTFIEIGAVNLKVDESVIVDADKANIILAVFSLITACQFIIAWVLIKILRKFISPMKDGNIFDAAVPKAIKGLAYYVFIGGLLTEICNAAGSFLIMHGYNMDALFDPAIVKTYSLNFELNGNFIVYAAIIYLFSYVFKYGAELQTQVDETL